MPLIKNDAIVADSWVAVADDEELPALDLPPRPTIVGLERWQRERDELSGSNRRLGLRLASHQSPALVAEDLGRFEVIALEFPKFTDGRAYSYARLLRERYGFSGEIRAVGNVLRDQLVAMARCGIDAFEVADARALEGWRAARSEISVAYQPGADRRRPAMALRAELGNGLAKAAAPEVEVAAAG